jgi:hypothetical protein
MKINIKLTDKKNTSRIDLASFEKSANEIYRNTVRPQVAKAKAIKKRSSDIKCNNPI